MRVTAETQGDPVHHHKEKALVRSGPDFLPRLIPCGYSKEERHNEESANGSLDPVHKPLVEIWIPTANPAAETSATGMLEIIAGGRLLLVFLAGVGRIRSD
eukprot:CAMPEP_0180559140 /NCGR_PEP_ID=MMETSP1037_2-20121125/2131_1 /TAXON_ID=632150 /ORGANISM="Azadinium spinosum, Strain 3D9" /LENGTH=100 /DNA_ID=CAMNT_0022575579 /DNA_START=872 /DNA_END=1174 /DNA_ORIENTATION=+